MPPRELLHLLALLLLWTHSPVLTTEEAPLVTLYAVRGQTARLPCNLTTEPEDPLILVLWYKSGTKTPIFSVDSRVRGHHHQEVASSSTRASDVFKGRASFDGRRLGWALVVREVEYGDQGEYRCRLDFQSSPTHNARVLLHVVDLPHQLRIYSAGGAQVEGAASVQKGHPLTLSCRATGGEPLPNVTWWSGSTLLDSEAEERQEAIVPSAEPLTRATTAAYVTNTLHLASVTRDHLSHTLTCTAANTPVLQPLTVSILLQETRSPLGVQMTVPPGQLSGGRKYDIKCEASGVRPPPVLTWWLRGQRLTHNIEVSLGVNSTVSVLRLSATAGKDGGLLECRASAPTLPHLTAAASTRLTVHYVPEATITIEGLSALGRMGGSVGGVGGLRAGDSATLTCAARANPAAYNFTFLFNGRPLHRRKVVESGPSLTLLQLDHRDVGLYTCLASNSVGDGQSNAVALHIDYAPVCEWEGVREVLASVWEKVEMVCRVKASPPEVTYIWESVIFTPNMEQIRAPLHHKDQGLASVGWAVADNSSISGMAQRVECLSENQVGHASQPCVFNILIVDEPSLLIGCHYHDVTTDSAGVTCSPGGTSSQLPQTYHIVVREGPMVVAAYNSSEPRFNITSLAPGRDYLMDVYASHAKGRGQATTLLLKTDTPKAEQVAPEGVPVNSKNNVEESLSPTEFPRNSDGTAVSVVVAGVVVGVVVGVAVVVAGVVTCRARRAHASSSSSQGKTHQNRNASRDSLLELRHGVLYQSCTSHPSCELLTTFSPGPVVVTQVTPRRSSRRASTRSAPGGTSHRGHRPRTHSLRGGPVHVVEVEADDVTTPRVEVHSPSRFSRLSLRGSSFRGDASSTARDSPPLSLHCEPLQKALSQPGALQSGGQDGPESDPQLHSTTPRTHLSPQPFLAPQVHHTPQPLATTHHKLNTNNLSQSAPPGTQLLPQGPTGTLPPAVSQDPAGTLLHSGTLPHTASHDHTASNPQTAILSDNVHLLDRPVSQTHTTTFPHTSTIPHTATIRHTATIPRGVNLSQLALQVHSSPLKGHSSRQPLLTPQSHVLLKSSEDEPPENQFPQIHPRAQPLTAPDPSPRQESTRPPQRSISPENTSINFLQLFCSLALYYP